jgi:dTDP-4-dehydrorhamnose reductase
MKRVLVIGANGQLGSDIVEALTFNNYEVIALTHQDIDLANLSNIQEQIIPHYPNFVINTAAYHNVELCEENKHLADIINEDAPAFISLLSAQFNFKFIHFSTDYVFDGNTKKPYTEHDVPKPLNHYGFSKYKGEKAVLRENKNNLVIRVSALYGKNPCRAKNGLNFVKLMLKLAQERDEVKVVADEFVSPTSTESVAKQLIKILKNPQTKGIVHATSEGECSWYEFAEEIFNYTKTKVNLTKANSTDFPAKVNRPKYSVLENAYLKTLGINIMPHWKTSLHNYLNKLKIEQHVTSS